MTDKDTALRYADQIANALRQKFPEHHVYVRHIEQPEYSFVEIALKHKKTNEEATVGYSQKFFEEMVDVPTKQERAKRLLKDLNIHLGIER